MVLSPFQSFTPTNNIGFKPNSASKVGSRAETASKRQLSVTSIDEETPALPDAKGSFLSFREGSGAMEKANSGASSFPSRAQSLASVGDVEFGLERTASMGFRINPTEFSRLFDTGASLMDSKADFSIGSANGKGAKDRWQRSIQLVEKGLAFNKAFKTLSTERRENVIDPERLSKIQALGSGAFATVELCSLKGETPEESSTAVAVKRLKPELLRNRKDLERFFNEAELLRKLDHKYIAHYIGVGNLSKKAKNEIATITAKEARQMLKSTFIVQEFVNGGSFRALVLQQMMRDKSAEYTDAQACQWMTQIAEALHYLHESNPKVVHRDLKLENILLHKSNGNREICLVDFGVSALLPFDTLRNDSASSLKHGRPRDARISEDLTGTWQELSQDLDQHMKECDLAIIDTVQDLHIDEHATHDLTARTGSYLYMAPEVFQAHQYNEKADIFSFGCVMYEVFARFVLSTVVVGPSGNPDTAKVYASKVAKGYRRPFPKSLKGTEIAELISDCWDENPKRRPSSAECVIRLLGILKRLTVKGALPKISKTFSKSISNQGQGKQETERVDSGCFTCFS